jgi:Flp pilus assembly protein TadG
MSQFPQLEHAIGFTMHLRNRESAYEPGVFDNFLDLLRARDVEWAVCNRQYFSNLHYDSGFAVSWNSFHNNSDRQSDNAGPGTLKKRFSLLSRGSRGQTLAEFGLAAALFFLFVFGIVEMGIIVYQYTTISMAAREATRYAAAHSPTSANPASTDQIKAIATNEAPFLSASEVTVTFPADPSVNLLNQSDAVVTISHTYSQHIPGMSPLTLTLTSSSQMLVSQ